MKAKARKSTPTKNAVSEKDLKEIVAVKLSTKTAIIVAVIGMVSAIAVAVIANSDKLASVKDTTGEEIGFHQGRASAVEHGFREVEGLLKAQIESAQRQGDTETASNLKDIAAEVQKGATEFHESYKRHIEAVKDGKRVAASQILLETNEKLTDLNGKLGTVKFYSNGPFVGGWRASKPFAGVDKPRLKDYPQVYTLPNNEGCINSKGGIAPVTGAGCFDPSSPPTRLPPEEYATVKIPLYGNGNTHVDGEGEISNLPENQRKLPKEPRAVSLSSPN
jgi:hypothetical protein